MSKIPQGEWSAIAARYAKGETISRIARSYGCTPPAIHYILKRGKLRAAQNPEQGMNGKPDSATTSAREPRGPATPKGPPIPRGEEQKVEVSTPGEATSPAGPSVEPRPAREPDAPMPSEPARSGLQSRATDHVSAFSAGLDYDLHGRAEAA